MSRQGRIDAVVAIALLILLTLQAHCAAQWVPQQGGTKARLRGLSVAGVQVAWATGAQGTVMRTIDGGANWRACVVCGGESLDFRDVHAFDKSSACVLAVGPGESSRIYRTADAGATWSLCHRGDDPKVFLDAIAFWDEARGLAMGDPIDGRFLILTTEDGGNRWSRLPGETLPPALPGEGAFAASGTCLYVQGERNAWFGTGGA
jgi:photosystem II stability/assembly factor-like uncharacterized protein